MTLKIVGIYGIRDLTSDKGISKIANIRNPSLSIDPVEGPSTSMSSMKGHEEGHDAYYKGHDAYYKGHDAYYEGHDAYYEGHDAYYEGYDAYYEGHDAYY